MHPTLCCIEGARITGKRSAQRARCVMAQVECDAQSHGCGPNAGTIDRTLVLLDLGMKKGFRTPPKTLTVEPGIPGVCCYFAVFSVYHDIGCLVLPTLPWSGPCPGFPLSVSRYFPKRSLWVPVRVRVSTSTSFSMR